MSVARPDVRTFLHRRTISCEGFQREDGLIDIEACLTDVCGVESWNEWRGLLAPGEPLHRMHLRVTLDERLTIRAIESVTEAAPYPACRDAASLMQRLVGLTIVGGFRRELRARIGGADGCTHVRALLDAVGSAALQTLGAYHRRKKGRFTIRDAEQLDPNRPSMLGTCRGYAADGPVAARLWPEDPRVVANHKRDAE